MNNLKSIQSAISPLTGTSINPLAYMEISAVSTINVSINILDALAQVATKAMVDMDTISNSIVNSIRGYEIEIYKSQIKSAIEDLAKSKIEFEELLDKYKDCGDELVINCIKEIAKGVTKFHRIRISNSVKYIRDTVARMNQG